jgi:hypothetical protein
MRPALPLIGAVTLDDWNAPSLNPLDLPIASGVCLTPPGGSTLPPGAGPDAEHFAVPTYTPWSRTWDSPVHPLGGSRRGADLRQEAAPRSAARGAYWHFPPGPGPWTAHGQHAEKWMTSAPEGLALREVRAALVLAGADRGGRADADRARAAHSRRHCFARDAASAGAVSSARSRPGGQP